MENFNTSNNMTNIHQILFDESPLLVRPALARRLCDSDMALIVQQVHYWITTKQQLSDDRTFKNGYMWVYNSITKWQEQFTWIPRKTLTRKFTKLREMGVLISDTLNDMKEDRTLWYRIDYEVLLSLPEKNYYEIECKKDEEKKMKDKKKKEKAAAKPKTKTEEKLPLGQNVPMYNINASKDEEAEKPQFDTLGQNGVMHLDILSQPIPKTSLPKISEDLFSKYVCSDVSPIVFFKYAISDKPTKYVTLELEKLTEKYGKDIVNESIKRLADKNTTNYIATLKGIIKRWQEQGMKSFEDIERVEKEYTAAQEQKRQQKQRSTKSNKSSKPVRKEMVPAWVGQEEKQTSPAEEMNELSLAALKKHVLQIAIKSNKDINVDIITLDNCKLTGTYLKLGLDWDEINEIFKAQPGI